MTASETPNLIGGSESVLGGSAMFSEAMSVSQLISVAAPGFLFIFLLRDKFRIAMDVVMAAFGQASGEYASMAATVSVIFVALAAGLLLRAVTFCELVLALRFHRYRRTNRRGHFWSDLFGPTDSAGWVAPAVKSLDDKILESVKTLSDIHQTMGGFIIVLVGGLFRMFFKLIPTDVPPESVVQNDAVISKLNAIAVQVDSLAKASGQPQLALELDKIDIVTGASVDAANVPPDMTAQYLIVLGLLFFASLAAWLSYTSITRLLAVPPPATTTNA